MKFPALTAAEPFVLPAVAVGPLETEVGPARVIENSDTGGTP